MKKDYNKQYIVNKIIKVNALLDCVKSEDEDMLREECSSILNEAIKSYKIMHKKNRKLGFDKKISILQKTLSHIKSKESDRADFKNILLYGKKMYIALRDNNGK